MTEMPYKPAHGAGLCDLCGQPGPLQRVVLEPSAEIRDRDGERYREARVAHVCAQHPAELRVGAPIGPPNRRMKAGTSRKRPQSEGLFDVRPPGPYET